MRRYRIRIKPEAEAQLDHLYDYSADGSEPETAARFVRGIADRIDALTTFPHRGTPRPDLGRNIRSTNHRGRCLVAYRVEGDEVVVLGVFYGGQDIPARFRNA